MAVSGVGKRQIAAVILAPVIGEGALQHHRHVRRAVAVARRMFAGLEPQKGRSRQMGRPGPHAHEIAPPLEREKVGACVVRNPVRPGSFSRGNLAFPVAGFLSGLAVRSSARSHAARFGTFLGLHGLILLSGWAWLSTLIGASAAFAVGVGPFLIGAVIKSGLAAALCLVIGPKQRT